MKIYILLAHPDKTSFNGKLAETYMQAAQAKGHEVRIQYLGDMQFNPILGEGYKTNQPLEQDLIEAQQNITWCEKWVIFYPVWWGNVPAILKGFLDRVLLPKYAFKYHHNSIKWDKLLQGRQAEIITTSDAPTFWLWWQYKNSDINAMKHAVLEFCGIKVKKITRIGNVRFLKEEQKQQWLQKVGKLA